MICNVVIGNFNIDVFQDSDLVSVDHTVVLVLVLCKDHITATKYSHYLGISILVYPESILTSESWKTYIGKGALRPLLLPMARQERPS